VAARHEPKVSEGHVCIEAESAAWSVATTNFRVKRPARGHGARFSRQTVGMPELTDQERQTRLKALNALLDLMRPSVQADGGDLVLVRADVETGVVEVQLQGACSSCAISSSTLEGGVTRILTDRLDWVTQVIGGVDESMDTEDSMSLGSGGYVPRYRQL
jgi:Fe-S cluster biogenesis protein NfuA